MQLNQLLSALFVCGVLFLVLQGLVRIWELNSSYYETVLDPYCTPSGFFGWGYSCNLTLLNQLEELQQYYDDYNFTLNFTLEG